MKIKYLRLLFLILAGACIIYIYAALTVPCDILSLGPGLSGYCLPASVAKVLNFFGDSVSPKEIETAMQTDKLRSVFWPKGNFQIASLLNIAGQYKKEIVFRCGNMTELKQLVNMGIPPIVHSNLNGISHTWVLAGFRSLFPTVTLSDSDGSDYEILSEKDFIESWKGENFEYLVISPPEKIPQWCVNEPGFLAKSKANCLYSKYNDKLFESFRESIAKEINQLKTSIEKPDGNIYYLFISGIEAAQKDDTQAVELVEKKMFEINPSYLLRNKKKADK
jgi:hypothetical protein